MIITINDKIQPLDRGDVYEDPLDEWLTSNSYGEVIASGTLLGDSGEIAGCVLEIALEEDIDPDEVKDALISKLENLGAPIGSKVVLDNPSEEIYFGKREGLGLYLDGVNLSPKVYEECDVNHVVAELQNLTGTVNDVVRYWQGETETGLFFYGQSFEQMKKSIASFITSYPLCEGARIEQIA